MRLVFLKHFDSGVNVAFVTFFKFVEGEGAMRMRLMQASRQEQ